MVELRNALIMRDGDPTGEGNSVLEITRMPDGWVEFHMFYPAADEAYDPREHIRVYVSPADLEALVGRWRALDWIPD